MKIPKLSLLFVDLSTITATMELLIADDHSMIRKGLRVICQSQIGIRQIDEVNSCCDLMKALRKKAYTHAIIDLVLSDGFTLEILPNIRQLYPDLNIMIFSMQPSGMYRSGLARCGITGFMSKAAPEKETFHLLQSFLAGTSSSGTSSTGTHSTSPIGNNAPSAQYAHTIPLAAGAAFSKFTPRETEVLHYLLMGMGSAEIARTLNMKQNTISTFKKRIFAKSNTKNVLELKELASAQKDVFND